MAERIYRSVARIKINKFDPLDIEIESNYAKEKQMIRTGQQVEVVLPRLQYRGQDMPLLKILLQVTAKKDERPLIDFMTSVYEALPDYRKFWERRKKELEEAHLPFLN